MWNIGDHMGLSFLSTKRHFVCLLTIIILPVLVYQNELFSSIHVTRIQAGHLQVVNALAWIPFILISIDANREGSRPGRVAAGAFFIAIQAVSGLPQMMVYAFYVSVDYTVARLPGCRKKMEFLCSQTVMTVTGILVAMVQLLPGYMSKGETLRAEGLSFTRASFGSLHPSHLIVRDWITRKKRSSGGSATILPAGRWQPGTFSADR